MNNFQDLSNTGKIQAILAGVFTPIDVEYLLEYAGLTEIDFEVGELEDILRGEGILALEDEETKVISYIYSPEWRDIVLETLEISDEEIGEQMRKVIASGLKAPSEHQFK